MDIRNKTAAESSTERQEAGVPGSGSNSRKTLFFRIIVFLLSLLGFGAFAPLGLDFHHDGVMFIPALRVAAGETVFRDVFCQYGLLSPLIQGLAVKIGGGELLAMKYCSVLFYAGIAVMLDMVWARLLTLKWRSLLLVMFWGLMPDTMVTFHAWSSIFALFFSLVSLWLLLKYFDEKRWYFPVLSGIAAGLTFLSRHPVGVVTAVALLAGMFFEAMLTLPVKMRLKAMMKNAGSLLAGLTAVLFGAALYLICNGAWDDFVLQCWSYVGKFVHNRSAGGNWGYFAESLFPFFTDAGLLDSIFAFLPMAALVWLAIGVRRAARGEQVRENLFICVLSVFSLGAWHQYYPVPCVRHLFWAGIPFFGFWILSLRELFSGSQPRKLLCRSVAVLMILVCIVAISVRVNSGILRLSELPRRRSVEIAGLKGMKLTRGEYSMINHIYSLYDSLPEHIKKRGVVNYTADGLWSVILPESGFRHPQFLWMGGGGLYPDYESRIVEHIKKYRPAVLYSKPLWLENYVPLISWQYMGENHTFACPLEL